MNKAELIAAVTNAVGVTRKEAEMVVNATFKQISDELQKGGQVQLVGFGIFETKKRAERIGKNPRTGEEIKIKGRIVPAFKPGKALRECVNGKNK